MDAQTIARLMTAGLAQPTGSDDTGLYTGVILTWDESSGVNTVQINGVAMSNLRVVQSGIGMVYQPGDTVMVQRKGSQYYIQGKVAAPGAGASGQIQSAAISANQGIAAGVGGFVDLGGPQVTVYIGSSRRALVMLSGLILAAGATGYVGGQINTQVFGTSSISPGTKIAAQAQVYQSGIVQSATTIQLFTAADGLLQGSNTFKLWYSNVSASFGCAFQERTITVIPF